jgi:hypothetical protein
MLPISFVLIAGFAYLTLLSSIASRGERRTAQGPRPQV